MLRAFFVFKIFKFSSLYFGRVVKRLDKKTKVNFKIYDVTDCHPNIRNTYIAKYLRK